jgi:DNA invertase Pin-like site-specific DNA recombinase
MPDPLIGYYRVSTDRQGKSGLGLDAQRADIHRYAIASGGELIAEFVEVESGRLNSRPILAEAMAACKKHKATLVIAKLDRLARNVSFVSSILDSRVQFVACDAPHADRTFLQILSVFAEHEARMISQRTKAALAAAKARGVILGRHGKILAEQNRADADTFAWEMQPHIAAAVADGAVTLKDVAHFLDRAGLRTREGAKWGPTNVQRTMLRLNMRTSAMARGTEGRIAA